METSDSLLEILRDSKGVKVVSEPVEAPVVQEVKNTEPQSFENGIMLEDTLARQALYKFFDLDPTTLSSMETRQLDEIEEYINRKTGETNPLGVLNGLRQIIGDASLDKLFEHVKIVNYIERSTNANKDSIGEQQQ